MPTFEVDVKAFVSIRVEAATADDARRAADAFVENCLSATHHTVIGYNEGLDADAVGSIIPLDYDLAVDGESEVEIYDETCPIHRQPASRCPRTCDHGDTA